jgi:hypothetical protein
MFAKTSILLLLLTLSQASSVDNADEGFGVDCSWPVHSLEWRCGDLLGDRKSVYENFMEGCRQHFGKKGSRCDTTERDRIEMSVRQPQSMVVSTHRASLVRSRTLRAVTPVISNTESHLLPLLFLSISILISANCSLLLPHSCTELH